MLTGFKAEGQRHIMGLISDRNLHINTACIISPLRDSVWVAVSEDSGRRGDDDDRGRLHHAHNHGHPHGLHLFSDALSFIGDKGAPMALD